MNKRFPVESQSDSALWITNLVNGVAGMTIKVKQALYAGSSPLQKIEVFDTYGYGRMLALAGTIMFTERDEFIYHEMISHPALCVAPLAASVCVIGGGDGGCVRQVRKHAGVKKITVVEIDAQVTAAVRTYFPDLAEALSDSRVTIINDDGHHYLNKTREQFDLIIVDSYDPGGPVQSLETEDFFKVVFRRLSDSGIAVIQTDSPILKSGLLKRIVGQISALFAEHRYYYCAIPSFPEGICGFIVCGKSSGALHKFDQTISAEIAKNCQYYNPEIHEAAFCLPQHIKQLLS
ncbi:MAG: polyamine aminopropyltransferase [Chitinivibrionales bacterium]|nr:polyamine aminopropyltransferase [Chitinivibrionales bacterium]